MMMGNSTPVLGFREPLSGVRRSKGQAELILESLTEIVYESRLERIFHRYPEADKGSHCPLSPRVNGSSR